MTREEWELLRNLDRRTQFLAGKMVEAEKRQERISHLEVQMTEVVMPTVEEVRKILAFRKKVHRVLLWGFSVAIGAAITTFVGDALKMYVLHDNRQVVHARVDTVKHTKVE